ncbi:MAG: hypothetical protein ACLQVG_20350 [Terriglobia bacterium]
MTNEPPPNDRLKSIWQNQPTEGIQMSIDEIRSRAGKFQTNVSWRNAREYVAAVIVVSIFAFDFWRTSDVLARVAFGLIIAGAIYVMWHLHQQGAARSVPAELGIASGLEFYRRELERQRDLLRSVWSWYLGPMLPGLVVLMLARARNGPLGLWRIGLTSALIAVIFVSAWWLNDRAARKLQSRIDELNALEAQR